MYSFDCSTGLLVAEPERRRLLISSSPHLAVLLPARLDDFTSTQYKSCSLTPAHGTPTPSNPPRHFNRPHRTRCSFPHRFSLSPSPFSPLRPVQMQPSLLKLPPRTPNRLLPCRCVFARGPERGGLRSESWRGVGRRTGLNCSRIHGADLSSNTLQAAAVYLKPAAYIFTNVATGQKIT